MAYELAVDAAWRKIRAKRHQPPGNASRNPRRLTFAAAMKQSEQFFRLSDEAGYETKPILLYYGLNQAARAIVAVGTRRGEPWELSGHGLTCPGLNQARMLGDVIVMDQGKDKSFQKLAELMNSPTLPAKIEFRELWGSLPEGAEVPLQGSWKLCRAVRLDILTKERSVYDSRYQSEVESVRLRGLPLHVGRGVGAEDLRKLLQVRYPSLRALVAAEMHDGRVRTGFTLGGEGSIRLAPADPRQVYGDAGELLRCGPKIYRDYDEMSSWVLPTIAGNTEPLAPIVTWWAILYVLSMLARYQPSAWTTMLDIDSSPDAPAVEYLLDEAHRVCINLIVAAFNLVEEEAYWQEGADDPAEA